MTFDEALELMNGRLRIGWKLGLERFTEFCRRLENPQDRFSVLHLTGTKGKGSTTAMAAALLKECGFCTGAYFSPYVYDVRERVQVNGEPISREDFARILGEIKPILDAMDDSEWGPVTEFELKTALGFRYFAEKQVEFVCLEVGIGGRLDATNIVTPVVSVITNIGLDHTQILGDTHAKIAFEKAGIIKPGVPALTAARNPEALEVILEAAEIRNAPLTQILRERESAVRLPAVWWRLEEGDPNTAPLTVKTPHAVYDHLPVRLLGDYQRENAACALAAVETALLPQNPFPLTSALARRALSQIALPGRLECFRGKNGALLVLDGAHNGMAAQALASPLASLRKTHGITGVRLVIGMLNGHDASEVVAPLTSGVVKAYVCAPNWKRAQPAEELAGVVRSTVPETQVYPGVEAAVFSAMQEAAPSEMVLVTGSFYTVGEVPFRFRVSPLVSP